MAPFPSAYYCTCIHSNVADIKPGTPTLTHALNLNKSIIAIAFLNDQLFVTLSGVAQVSVYNTTSLQLQRQLTFTGLGPYLYGLAACTANNYLYISDNNNHCIHRVDLSIAGANTLIKWRVANYQCALSVNSARNILVAYREVMKVQEYTPTGSLVREISDGNQLWQAIERSSGLLAVSRRGPANGIFTVSMSTQLKHGYGNRTGSGAGQMNSPCGLSVDSDGYILVADKYNRRILVINPSLTDDRQLPLPSLKNPYSLVLDRSRGRLYVGEVEDMNRLLVFDNVTNVGALFNN